MFEVTCFVWSEPVVGSEVGCENLVDRDGADPDPLKLVGRDGQTDADPDSRRLFDLDVLKLVGRDDQSDADPDPLKLVGRDDQTDADLESRKLVDPDGQIDPLKLVGHDGQNDADLESRFRLTPSSVPGVQSRMKLLCGATGWGSCGSAMV